MKKLFVIGTLLGVMGCGSLPQTLESGDISSESVLPILGSNEFVYYLDRRFDGAAFLRGYLVLQSDSQSAILALRSVDLETGKESYKEVKFQMGREGRISHRIVLRRGENVPAFEQDIQDAGFFLALMPSVSYIDEVLVRLPATHPLFSQVSVSFSLMFPVFNVLRMDFPEDRRNLSYYLYRAGVIDDGDFAEFQNLQFVAAAEMSGRFPIRAANRIRTPVKYIEADLDNQWVRQQDGSYWLQVHGIRDAYIDSAFFNDLLSRLIEMYPKVAPEVYDALAYRLIFGNNPLDYSTMALNFYDNGSSLKISTFDENGIGTYHHYQLLRTDTGFLLIGFGGFYHVIMQNQDYFNRILASIRLNTTPAQNP